MNFRYNGEKFLSFLFVSSFFLASLTGIIFASQYLWARGNFNALILIARFVLVTLGFAYCFIKGTSKKWLFFLGGYFCLICLSGIFFIDNTRYSIITLQKFIPMAFITVMLSSIKDYCYVFKYLRFYSLTASFILVLFIIYLLKKGLIGLFAAEDTYMLFSYSVLPFVCGLLILFYNKKSWLDLFCFFCCSIIMTLFGCRGALISLIVCFIILFFQKNIIDRRYFKLIIVCITVLLCSIMIFMSLSEINVFTKNQLGINSRLLRKLSSSRKIDSISTGRTRLYSIVIDEINKKPLSFRGINADSVLIGGIYCHNIFLEVIYDFGVIGGCLFGCVIVLLFYYTIFIKHDNLQNNLILFFFAIGVIKLLVSSSIFYETYFWCWLLLLIKKMKYFGCE